MHILFLTDNFPPEGNAPASRTFEHARVWVRLGHKVTVITCAPNFPDGKVFDGYSNDWLNRETMEGIDVIRVKTYITANEGFVKRILDFMSFMVSGFFAGLFVKKPDVVVATSPQFFTAVSVWAVSAFKRKPFVFELRDVWPASITAVGAMKKSLVIRLLEKLEIFPSELEKRQIVSENYNKNIKELDLGIKLPVLKNKTTSSWAQYTIILPENINRDRLQENLKSRNVPTAVYYPIPLNQHKPYAKYPISRNGLAVTNYLSKNVLSLPMHPYLSEDDIIFITQKIYESIKNI